MNTSQLHVIYLLNCLMMSQLTRRKSRQFNFSLHAKINHIEFEDNFFDKIHEDVKYSPFRRLLKCSNEKERNEHWTTFGEIFGKIGSTERPAVSSRPFLYYVQFYKVQWRHSKVEVTFFMPAW